MRPFLPWFAPGQLAFVCAFSLSAAELYVRTTTGDVTGALLSEKVFITGTNTGSVAVPETTTGGVCEIRTNTGSIRIGITQP